MSDRAVRAIADAFATTNSEIGTFNELIERLTTAAVENGMARERVLSLVLQEATAQAGMGRREARGQPGPRAMIYKTVQDNTMAARTGVDALRQS